MNENENENGISRQSKCSSEEDKITVQSNFVNYLLECRYNNSFIKKQYKIQIEDVVNQEITKSTYSTWIEVL